MIFAIVNTITAGTYSATIDVTNNTVTAGYPACFIYAVYEGEELKDVDFEYESLAKGVSKTFELTNITVGENQSLKLFLWQDFETLNILKGIQNKYEEYYNIKAEKRKQKK